MPRIFGWIAVTEALLFLTTGAFGLLWRTAEGQRAHVGLSLFTVLLAAFMHALVFTYFSVTGKLIHQATALGKLDTAAFERVRDMKRRNARLVLAAMLSIVVAVGTGAWRLSGVEGPRWHLAGGALALLINLYTFLRQYDIIVQGDGLLRAVMEAYQRGRTEAMRPS